MRLTLHRPVRLPALAAGLALTAGLALGAGAGVAQAHPTAHVAASRVVGHLYVNDNTAPVNTISAYDRHADGSLSPVPGSPFQTGGAGTGSPIGSQGSLQKADDGQLLLAVDAGSNEISAMHILPDGALAPVTGGTVASGGDKPVSIAVHGTLVYVANAGTDNNYTGFTLSSTGSLTPLAGSTVTLPAGSDPGDVLINGPGTRVLGVRVASSLIDSFKVGSDGLLQAAPGSPYAAQGPGPFGSEFSPIHPYEVFVSNAHGGAGAGTVSAFQDGAGGALSSVTDGPFANGQTAPCWVTISASGRFLYSVNTGTPSISGYAVAPSGALTLVGSAPFAGTSTSPLGPEDARLTPDQSTLWVVDTAGDALSAFHVAGGSVTAMPQAQTALPAGAAPFGIVMTR